MLASRFAAPHQQECCFQCLRQLDLLQHGCTGKPNPSIFDDLDTVLLMIPLKMMIVGLAWQLGFAVV